MRGIYEVGHYHAFCVVALLGLWLWMSCRSLTKQVAEWISTIPYDSTNIIEIDLRCWWWCHYHTVDLQQLQLALERIFKIHFCVIDCRGSHSQRRKNIYWRQDQNYGRWFLWHYIRDVKQSYFVAWQQCVLCLLWMCWSRNNFMCENTFAMRHFWATYSEQLVSSSVVLVAWPWKMSEWSQREQVSWLSCVCVCG